MTRGPRRLPRAAAVAVALVLGVLGGAPGAVASGAGGAAEPVVDLGGTPVPSPGTDPGAPVPLEAGLWADTLPSTTGEAPHQFVYTRTMADSQVHVGVSAVGLDPTDTTGIELATFAADGTDCGTVTASPSYAVPGAFGGATVVGATEPGERGTPCGDADEIRIEVGRASSSTASETEAVLRIVEEAPASAGDPSAVDADPPPATASAPAAGTARPVEGATSYLDAPVLGDGTVSDTIALGGVGLYRVRLERGQSLAVGVTVPLKDAAALEALQSYGDPAVDLTLVDPARAVESGVLDDAVTSTSYSDAGDVVEDLVDGVPAVSWLNGFDDTFAGLPGDYWVSVAVGEVEATAPVEVPVEVTVAVGDAEVRGGPGQPAYPDVVTGPRGTAGPEGYAATTPFLVAPDEFAAAVPANPGAPATAAGGDTTRSVARTAAGAALGVAGLVCLVGGAVLLRRRRAAG